MDELRGRRLRLIGVTVLLMVGLLAMAFPILGLGF
jgi:hypothetical protein